MSSTDRDDTTPVPAHHGAAAGERPHEPHPAVTAPIGTGTDTQTDDTQVDLGPDEATRPVPVGGTPETTTPAISTSPRVGTVVWGLVLAIVGVGLISVAAGAQLDLELAVIGLLALAGVALVVGSVVTAARRRR